MKTMITFRTDRGIADAVRAEARKNNTTISDEIAKVVRNAVDNKQVIAFAAVNLFRAYPIVNSHPMTTFIDDPIIMSIVEIANEVGITASDFIALAVLEKYERFISNTLPNYTGYPTPPPMGAVPPTGNPFVVPNPTTRPNIPTAGIPTPPPTGMSAPNPSVANNNNPTPITTQGSDLQSMFNQLFGNVFSNTTPATPVEIPQLNKEDIDKISDVVKKEFGVKGFSVSVTNMGKGPDIFHDIVISGDKEEFKEFKKAISNDYGKAYCVLVSILKMKEYREIFEKAEVGTRFKVELRIHGHNPDVIFKRMKQNGWDGKRKVGKLSAYVFYVNKKDNASIDVVKFNISNA